MATNKLKTLSDIESLTNDVEEFFKNPNFSPKRQNKYFFSEGTSYYKQLLEVSRVIKLLQTSLANIYDNQNVLQEEYESLDVAELTGLKTKVEDLETTCNDLLVRVDKLEADNITNKENIATNTANITARSTQLTELINDNLTKINANITEIDKNKANIQTNTNDIATNKANISTNKTDIATNKTNINTLSSKVSTAETKVSEMGTKVDNMDTKVTTAVNDVEDVKENYLKDIKIDSTDIQFTDVSKTKGIKEIQASIISSTPADLGTQLTAVKAQNSNLVTNVGNATVNEDTTNKVVNVTQDVTTLENGIPTTDTKNIVSFDTDDFSVDDNGKVSTTVDISSMQDNLNTVMTNYQYETNLEVGNSNKNSPSLFDYSTGYFTRNPLEFISSGVLLEKSTDNGNTWVTLPMSDEFRHKFFSIHVTESYSINFSTLFTSYTSNNIVRLTVNFSEAGIYCDLAKILIYRSGSGSNHVKIEAGDINSGDLNYTTVTEMELIGWPYWNSANVPIKHIGKTTWTPKYQNIRISIYGNNYSNTLIEKIIFISTYNYTNREPLALSNSGYKLNWDKSVTFYGNVTSPNINTLSNNINSNTNKLSSLEEEYTAQQEVLTDHETLINNNATNITSLQATTNTLNINFFNLESRVSTVETSVGNCYTKSETDTAISNAINSAITSAINASY